MAKTTSTLSLALRKKPRRLSAKSIAATPQASAGIVLDARERLLSTARKLFYKEGPRAVGIDRVLAESGVAKMSLYRHFGSKDALIVACLQAHERDYWQLWDIQLDVDKAVPAQQIRNAMSFMARRTSDPTYQGCIFLNTAQTFPDKSHPAHQTAIAHKRQLAARLLKLCKGAGADDPRALARQLLLLINGTQATAGMLGKETQHAIVDAAEALLRSQGIN